MPSISFCQWPSQRTATDQEIIEEGLLGDSGRQGAGGSQEVEHVSIMVSPSTIDARLSLDKEHEDQLTEVRKVCVSQSFLPFIL